MGRNNPKCRLDQKRNLYPVAMSTVLQAHARRDAKTDWNVKEQVRAKLRTSIKRLLPRYGHPPDGADAAADLVLQQAETIAGPA